MVGTHYVDSHVTTGFANQLARPLFRDRQRDDMSEEEALELLYDGLKVCVNGRVDSRSCVSLDQHGSRGRQKMGRGRGTSATS